MSAEKISNPDNKKELVHFTIGELVDIEEWNYVLIRLNSMKFIIPFEDKMAIIQSGKAPLWLKNATYVCKTLHSA